MLSRLFTSFKAPAKNEQYIESKESRFIKKSAVTWTALLVYQFEYIQEKIGLSWKY